jgi:hypothetical protein
MKELPKFPHNLWDGYVIEERLKKVEKSVF